MLSDILYFKKDRILMAHRMRNVKMRNRVSFAAVGQSIIDISRFLEFQDGTVRHLGFLKI